MDAQSDSRYFAELIHANPSHSRLKQWAIRSVEGGSGRDRYAALCRTWRDEAGPLDLARISSGRTLQSDLVSV
jgi:hypothetical protein